MLLSELLTDFLGYCKVERGMTKATLTTYGANLRHFLRYVAEQGEPAPTEKDFATPLLRRYQYSVSATGVRPRTVRSKINALRSWGTFLTQNGVIPENYALALKQPKKDAHGRTTCPMRSVWRSLRRVTGSATCGAAAWRRRCSPSSSTVPCGGRNSSTSA